MYVGGKFTFKTLKVNAIKEKWYESIITISSISHDMKITKWSKCLQVLWVERKNCKIMRSIIRSSYEERMVNALALGADEGRDKLRKALGRRK